jgi:hypothetical protein
MDELSFILEIRETGTARCHPQGQPALSTDDRREIVKWYEAGHEIVMEKTCPPIRSPLGL